MYWIENLIMDFCNTREVSFHSKFHTVGNFFSRTFTFGKLKARIYNDLASTDICVSKQLQKLVEKSCESVSNGDLRKGMLALKLHVSTMDSRNDYLLMFATLLAALAVAFRFLGWEVVSLSIVFIGIGMVAIERSRIIERKHQLEELFVYLEYIEEIRSFDE